MKKLTLLIVLFSSLSYSQIITVDLLKEYQTECYNDSVIKMQHYKYFDCITYSKCGSIKHYEPVWTHKEPLLSDFIDWVLSITDVQLSNDSNQEETILLYEPQKVSWDSSEMQIIGK